MVEAAGFIGGCRQAGIAQKVDYAFRQFRGTGCRIGEAVERIGKAGKIMDRLVLLDSIDG